MVKCSTESPDSAVNKSPFQFFEELGSGSFGKVYRAYEKRMQKVVAVKMIELDTSGDIEDVLLELKFLSELRCKQITRHFYAHLQGSVLCVVMEYCAAGSCLHMLKRCGLFKEPSAIHVLHETLKGLEYIHDQNKIHRDLKSANILVTDTGGIKIADFGVSAQLSLTIPERNSFMGTPYWMAPEIIEASQYDTAVDIWSLGIVAFELITGSPPYRKLHPTEAMVKIVKFGAPPLPQSVRGIPLSMNFHKLVTSCLDKDPARRPTASELLQNKLFKGRLGYGSPNMKPPHEFMEMVRACLSKHAVRAREARVHGIEDLAILAPAKSEHSKPNNIDIQFDYGTNMLVDICVNRDTHPKQQQDGDGTLPVIKGNHRVSEERKPTLNEQEMPDCGTVLVNQSSNAEKPQISRLQRLSNAARGLGHPRSPEAKSKEKRVSRDVKSRAPSGSTTPYPDSPDPCDQKIPARSPDRPTYGPSPFHYEAARASKGVRHKQGGPFRYTSQSPPMASPPRKQSSHPPGIPIRSDREKRCESEPPYSQYNDQGADRHYSVHRPQLPPGTDPSAQIVMHSALSRVIHRTRIPDAVCRIEEIGRDIDEMNVAFPGFTRALIEEICRGMIEKRV